MHNDADEVLEKDLDGRLKDWHRARELEAFAAAVRERARSAGQPTEADTTVERWLEWADITVKYFDGSAIDRRGTLGRDYNGYKLRSRFGWGHDLATADVLNVFFTPIEDLVKELDEKAQPPER